MPSPIQLNSGAAHDSLFGDGGLSSSSFSALQESVFGNFAPTEQRTAGKIRVEARLVKVLESIYKGGSDDVLTAASAQISGGYGNYGIARAAAPSQLSEATRSDEGSALYRVPSFVGEYDLVSLKSEGLVRGSGRSVQITRSGEQVLSDHWLSSKNDLRENRPSPRFDWAQANSEFNAAGRYCRSSTNNGDDEAETPAAPRRRKTLASRKRVVRL